MDDSSIHTEMSVMTISSNTTALSSSSRRTIFPTVDLNHPKYASPKRVASHSHERIHRNRRRTETSISCSSTCSVSSDTSSLLSDMLVQGTHQTSSPIRTAPSQQAYDMAHITTQHRVSSPKPTFAHLNLPPSSKKSKKTKNKNILSRIHNFSPTSSSSKSTTNRSNFKHHSHTSLPSSSPTPYYPVQVSSSLSSGTTSSVSTINDQPFSVRPSSAPEPNVSRMTSTNTILQSNVTSSSVATPTAPMNTISSQYYVTSTSAASTPTIPTITINPPPQSSSSPRSRSSRTKSPTKSSKSYTLEERLFHALHTSKINGPSIKEFKECWAFANVVQNYYKKEKIDLVLDVAGGHGALGALLLILLSSSKNSVVIDPAVLTTDGGGVQYAWSEFLNHKGKQDNSSMDDDDDDDDDDNFQDEPTMERKWPIQDPALVHEHLEKNQKNNNQQGGEKDRSGNNDLKNKEKETDNEQLKETDVETYINNIEKAEDKQQEQIIIFSSLSSCQPVFQLSTIRAESNYKIEPFATRFICNASESIMSHPSAYFTAFITMFFFCYCACMKIRSRRNYYYSQYKRKRGYDSNERGDYTPVLNAVYDELLDDFKDEDLSSYHLDDDDDSVGTIISQWSEGNQIELASFDDGHLSLREVNG